MDDLVTKGVTAAAVGAAGAGIGGSVTLATITTPAAGILGAVGLTTTTVVAVPVAGVVAVGAAAAFGVKKGLDYYEKKKNEQ